MTQLTGNQAYLLIEDRLDAIGQKFRVLQLPKLQREGIPLDWPTTKVLEKDPGFFGRYN